MYTQRILRHTLGIQCSKCKGLVEPRSKGKSACARIIEVKRTFLKNNYK